MIEHDTNKLIQKPWNSGLNLLYILNVYFD